MRISYLGAILLAMLTSVPAAAQQITKTSGTDSEVSTTDAVPDLPHTYAQAEQLHFTTTPIALLALSSGQQKAIDIYKGLKVDRSDTMTPTTASGEQQEATSDSEGLKVANPPEHQVTNTSVATTESVSTSLVQSPQIYAQTQPVRPVSPLPTTTQPAPRRVDPASGDPDVLLDVPNLSVEEINLDVENLRARVSLDARLANLLALTAGADVTIDKVKLTIKGVKATVLLKVKLDNVAAIIDRTLTTVDRNPEILNRLLQSVDNTVGTVGGVTNTALQPGGVASQAVGTVGQTLNNVSQPGGLLSQTVNTLGQTVQRTVNSTGSIVERTLDNTGKVVNQRTVANLTRLPVLSQTKNASGQTVRRVRDNSGAILEYTLDSAGKVINSKVVSPATGTQR